MTTAVPPHAPHKLPVVKTAEESYIWVVENRRHLVRASTLPLCLSLLLTALDLVGPQGLVFAASIVFLQLLPFAIFEVAWHRFTLLGPEAAAPALVSGWGRRHCGTPGSPSTPRPRARWRPTASGSFPSTVTRPA